ncbi:ABC transporter substrate-binding protein [Neobacillus sp. D3-1R]|uniref:SgrR family transcriptional regulator n=1 Tax=Neobacillus sp. D3-1R TaxID=3445778 RepID=UPI003FA14BA1
MNIEQYYLTLRKHFRHIPEGESYPVRIDDITEILDCTRRNTQLVLNRMSEQNWILWQPGRGRGNPSQLTFKQPLHDFILEKAKQLALEKKLDDAWKLINEEHIQLVKFEFTEWLYRHLGFHLNNEQDVLRFPFYRPVLDLDPTFVHRRTEAHWVKQIFNTLVTYDSKTKQIVPELAYFWESNEDYTSWRFFLRKGIRFHHGKSLTSEDIAFTFERILKESSDDNIKMILKEIKIIGRYSFELILRESNVLFIHFLCSENFSIVPSDMDEWKFGHPFARLPIGTGPFRMEENNESMLTVTANEHYFAGRPHLDRIEMWVWPNYEESRMVHQLEKDDIYFGEFPVNKDSHTHIQKWEKGCTYLTFHLGKEGPLQDEHLRSAIHLAIDRKKMLKELNISGIPATCFFPEQSRVNFANESNIEKAVKLLKNSSYNGETLFLYTYEMPTNERNAKWIQNELKKMGIQIEVVILPIKDLTQRDVFMKADLIVAGEVLGEQEDISIIEMFMNSNGVIHNHLGEKQRQFVNEHISLCKKETDLAIRMEYLNKIQQSLKNDFNLLYLYHVQQTVVHNHSLQGMMLNSWGKVDYKNIWFKHSD